MNKIFSPNMLKTYSSCPKKFYLQYVNSISMPVNENIFEAGKNIHALASYYLKKEQIDKMENSLSEKEKRLWGYLKQLNYFSYEYIASEYNLNIKLDGYIFGGRLDALLKKDNRYYILDYKTGNIPENAVYDYQTMIYMLAVSEFFDTKEIDFIYIDLKNQKECVVTFNDKLALEYKEKLISVAKSITNNDFFTKNKKPNCKCEYSLICY